MARGVAGDWPVQGLTERLHLDNAKEFHSEALKRGCEQYGIARRLSSGADAALWRPYRAADRDDDGQGSSLAWHHFLGCSCQGRSGSRKTRRQ